MRIVIVDTYYEGFQSQLYAARPDLAELPFAQQRAELLDRFFGTADFYSRSLRALGHEAEELAANAEPLQRRWAAEAGLSLPRRRGRALEAILDAQVEALDPDVVYVQHMAAIPRRQLDRWRRAGRLVAGQIAVAPPPKRLVQGYDLIVTSFPHYPERFRALGVDSEYLPLAFEPRVLERLGPVEKRYDAVFVGGVDPKVHPEGTRLLEQVADPLGLDVWGYGAGGLAADSPLRARWHGELWGLDMYRVFAEARVVVNRHIEAAEGHANNMRLFEASGAGAAVVTERAPNLTELFEPGVEVATYEGAAELQETVAGLLADEDRRATLARAGQERTLRDHSYAVRMAQLVKLLEPRLLR
ncbi:MAG: hypothetical protein QOF37_1723 [Thermoleophilaceae bacterium]|nr:hypothetical protein [Thermoleophilaceae bacterium]